jgi:beta-galactosidase
MPMMDESLAKRLGAFVEGGGVLVVTARSAIRDRNNQVVPTTPPGLLAELCGATVEEFGRLEEGAGSLYVDEPAIPCGQGYELLALRGAEAAGTWGGGPDGAPFAAAGSPAVTLHHVGRGAALYVGTFLSRENVEPLMDLALSHARIQPLVNAADFVEVTRRRASGRTLTFLLNHYPKMQVIPDPPEGTYLLGGRTPHGELHLPAWDVAIVETRTR